MKITHLFCLTLMLCLSLACNQNSSKSSEETRGSAQGKLMALPFLKAEDIQQLLATTETVDMIFFNLPISVSQDDPASAKNSVMYISPAAPTVAETCKADGRMMWISQGAILREADFYLGDGCYQFVFMENNTPAYRNAMSVEAVQFFTTIVKQASQPPKQ